MTEILKKFLLSSLLCVIFFTVIFPLQVIARDLKVGSHGDLTNMILSFSLPYNLEAGNYVRVFFHSVGEGATSNHLFLTNLTTASPNADFSIYVGGSSYPVTSTSTVNGYFAAVKYGGGSVSDYVRFQAPPDFTTVTAGATMWIYFGAPDDDTAPMEVVSKPSLYVGGYNANATHYIINPPDENSDNSVDVEVIAEQESTGGSKISRKIMYEVDTAAVTAGEPGFQVDVEGEVDPYLYFNFSGASGATLSLNADNATGAKDVDIISGVVNTNSPQGYSLRYRATPLVNEIDPTEIITSAGSSEVVLLSDGTVEAWGIGMQVSEPDGNTATVPTVYDYGDTGFAVITDNALHEIIAASTASQTDFDLEIGASVTAETSALRYLATITFNVYTNF